MLSSYVKDYWGLVKRSVFDFLGVSFPWKTEMDAMANAAIWTVQKRIGGSDLVLKSRAFDGRYTANIYNGKVLAGCLDATHKQFFLNGNPQPWPRTPRGDIHWKLLEYFLTHDLERRFHLR